MLKEHVSIGRKVRLKSTSRFYSQAPNLIGEIIDVDNPLYESSHEDEVISDRSILNVRVAFHNHPTPQYGGVYSNSYNSYHDLDIVETELHVKVNKLYKL